MSGKREHEGSTSMKRWRGLKAIVQDVVREGASAVERVHLATADRSFFVAERIPPIADSARAIHAVHDASVAGVYAMIRLVNQVVGSTVDVVLDTVEAATAQPPGRED